MPIVLRICVAIDSDAALPLTLAAASSQAAVATKTVAAVDGPTTSFRELGAIPSVSEVCAASNALASSSISDDTSEQRRHFHWFSPFSELIKNSEQTIRVSSARDDASARRCGKAQTATAVRESCPPASICIAYARDDVHLDPSQEQPRLAPRRSTSMSRRSPELQQESTPPLMRHKLLLWLSMEVMLTTTVNAILEQVWDTVERRMHARVCTDVAHDPNHNAGKADSVQDSLALWTLTSGSSDGGGGRKDHNGGSVVRDTNAAEPSASRTSVLMDRFHEGELCLCLQDKDGGYHWVGSTRHFHKAAVLQAPFITEACLRSNAIFEEERRRQCIEAQQQRASSTRPSSLSTLGSCTPSLPPTPGHSTELMRNAGDSRARCSRRADRHPRSKGTQPAVGSRGPAVPSAASATADQYDVARTSIDQTLTRNAGKRKFAFVRGVVIPMSVLRQRNPQYAVASEHHPHGRTPRQYAVVRVPTDMQEEPLDGFRCSSEAAVASSMAQVDVEEAATHASPHAEALPAGWTAVPTSDSPGDKAVRSPASPNSISAPLHRTISAKAPPRAAALMSASSMPTLPSHPAQLNWPCGGAEAADRPNAHLAVFDTSQVSPNGSTVTAAASPAATAQSFGLGTQFTTVGGASEVNGLVATADALCSGRITNVQACEALTKEEDLALIALATAQQEYTAALAEYNAAVSHSAAESAETGVCKAQPLQASLCADAELSSLLQRKIELQRRLEACREAELQCERLTTLAERLEKEVQEREERRMLLARQLHRHDSAAFVSSH